MSNRLRVIDLFSGAGGLSLGLAQAGWCIEAALEFTPVFSQTHHLNHPHAEQLNEDVRSVDFRRFYGIDVVAGGPPCQPFSVSGKQLGKDDIRDMLPQFVRAVSEIRPRAFLMENVAGLAGTRFRRYLEDRITELRRLNYDVYWSVLNAADFGVPQKRERLIVVGLPRGSRFEFPHPTHGPQTNKPWVTVRQALEGCPKDDPNRARITYAKNPILRSSPYAGMLVNGQGRPLDPNAPSNTIPASAGGNRTHIIDPKNVLARYHALLQKGKAPRTGLVRGCRRLTVRESARLQAFPDSYNFLGSRSQQYCQIGNAVPPPLGQAIAKAISRALL